MTPMWHGRISLEEIIMLLDNINIIGYLGTSDGQVYFPEFQS